MRALAIVLVSVLGLASGCSRDSRGPSAYQQDIDRLCHAEQHSGAHQLDPDYRPVAIAQWLAENLETAEVREVLVEFQAGSPAEKRAVLEREAAAVGLVDCPLAKTWAAEEEDAK